MRIVAGVSREEERLEYEHERVHRAIHRGVIAHDI